MNLWHRDPWLELRFALVLDAVCSRPPLNRVQKHALRCAADWLIIYLHRGRDQDRYLAWKALQAICWIQIQEEVYGLN